MSIYCSEFSLGFEHKSTCPRMKRVGRKAYEQDDSKPCTCATTPIRYQGSHVLPRRTDKRGGDIGFASIPPHITLNGKDDANRHHPYMRFHLFDGYQDSVVLTKAQVKLLRDALTAWLDRMEVRP